MVNVGLVTDPSGKIYEQVYIIPGIDLHQLIRVPTLQRLRYFQGVGTSDVTADIVDKNLRIFQRPRAVFDSAFGSGTGSPLVVRGLRDGCADMSVTGYMDILKSAYKVRELEVCRIRGL